MESSKSSSLSLLAVYTDSESDEEIPSPPKRCRNHDEDNVANKALKNENRYLILNRISIL